MRAEFASYAPDAAKILQAFTEGINAYIASLSASGGSRLPEEFRLAGFAPEPWRPEDWRSRMNPALHRTRPARHLPRSADGEGLPNGSDQCAFTPAGTPVHSTGCSIAQLCLCAAVGRPWHLRGTVSMIDTATRKASRPCMYFPLVAKPGRRALALARWRH